MWYLLIIIIIIIRFFEDNNNNIRNVKILYMLRVGWLLWLKIFKKQKIKVGAEYEKKSLDSKYFGNLFFFWG